ncbi:MAG: hypothetical protein ACKVOK_04010 [Flavobacteriales bacterium]
MENIAFPITIPKRTEDASQDDFFTLIAQAIQLAQAYSYQQWTDYNLHDPGVTILEQLCFAVSDILYRMEFPIEDLLTNEKGEIDSDIHSFFSKEKILTTNPVTLTDVRKSLLDSIDEIENVHITPLLANAHWGALNGLYKISIQLSEGMTTDNNSQQQKQEDITAKIRKHYAEIRNLGEDSIQHIEILQPLQIKLKFKIAVPEISDVENVLLQIIETIRAYFNAGVHYQSREEAFRNGISTDEIYDGPNLKHGFISEADMPPHLDNVDALYLLNLLNKISGIKFIQQAEITEPSTKLNVPISIPPGFYAHLDIDYLVEHIQFTYQDHVIKMLPAFVQSIKRKLSSKRSSPLYTAQGAIIHRGKFRNPGVYHSIQNYFPALYGIGKFGFNNSKQKEFSGASKQLKAYLYFMEQILANFLQQISNLGKLYAPSDNEANEQTYSFESHIDIPGIKDVIRQYTILQQTHGEKEQNQLHVDQLHSFQDVLKYSNETFEVYFKRKNAVLDHLLARFNIRLNLTPIYHYFKYYGASQKAAREQKIIHWKNDILRTIPILNYSKFRGLNYTLPGNSTPFSDRIAKYLYIDNSKLTNLTNGFQTGKVALFKIDESKQQNNFTARIENIIWNSETYQVIMNSDEVLGQTDQAKLLAGGIQTSKLHLFLKRGKSIFKHGIEKSHYRIVPLNSSPAQVLIIFRAPEDEYWQIVSRHASSKDAEQALQSIISQLHSINIESEGFHLIEHHLLRPSFDAPVFGYRFLIAPDIVIFENGTFKNHSDRENEIDRCIELSRSVWPNPSIAVTNLPSFKIRYYPIESPNTPIEITSGNLILNDNPLLSRHCETIVQHIKKLDENNRAHYPRFEYTIQFTAQTTLPESFLSQRLSFLFPAWTARFQDPEFREFAHSLITSQSPAHLKSEVFWLTIAQMIDFEKLYTLWKQELQLKKLQDNSYSESLLLLLFNLKK